MLYTNFRILSMGNATPSLSSAWVFVRVGFLYENLLMQKFGACELTEILVFANLASKNSFWVAELQYFGIHCFLSSVNKRVR